MISHPLAPAQARDYDDEDRSREEAAAERTAELRAMVVDAGELAALPEPTPLIDGWLYEDSLGWLFGSSGHCKSFAALDMTGCIASGSHWHGHAVKQAACLYIALEGAAGLKRRVAAWEEYNALPMQARFMAPKNLHVVYDADPLAMVARDIGAACVVIDTQNRATVGLDENSAVDMGHMIAALERIRSQTEALVLLVHHTAVGSARDGPTRRPRGHGSIDGAAQTMIRVVKDGQLVVVQAVKQKDTERVRSVQLAARPVAGSLVLAQIIGAEQPMADSEATLQGALRNLVELNNRASFTELKRACMAQGMPESTFNWALRRQVGKGAVTKDGTRYTLADPPEAAQRQPQLSS